MSEPTTVQTAAFHAHMAAHFRAQIIDKRSAPEMVAWAHAQTLGSRISAEEAMTRYATTVGDRIYLPYTPGEVLPGWSRWGQIQVMTHECRHIDQPATHGGLVGLALEGLHTTGMAQVEFEARLTTVELHYWRFGELFDLAVIAGGLSSYGCTVDDVAYVEAALAQAAETVTRGGIITEPGRVAIAWLTENAPEIRALV